MSGDWINRVHFGDCLETLRRMPGGIVHTCVTSPPYFGLRDYGHAGQIGLEETPEQFIAKLVEVFREVRRVLRDDGTCWVNMGDSYANAGGAGGTGTRGGLAKAAEKSDGNVRSAENRSDKDGGLFPRARPSSIGDGVKAKDLIGVPWALAFALRADGWYLRQDIIWAKPNPMPESVTDRCTKSHEYIFLLSKGPRYYYDAQSVYEDALTSLPIVDKSSRSRNRLEATANPTAGKDGYGSIGQVEEGKRNRRSVWTVSTKPYAGAHFATYPEELIEPCILAGAPAGGVVLDPFFGSGTTGQVAQNLGRHWIGLELNPAYKALQDERLRQPGLILESAF